MAAKCVFFKTLSERISFIAKREEMIQRKTHPTVFPVDCVSIFPAGGKLQIGKASLVTFWQRVLDHRTHNYVFLHLLHAIVCFMFNQIRSFVAWQVDRLNSFNLHTIIVLLSILFYEPNFRYI